MWMNERKSLIIRTDFNSLIDLLGNLRFTKSSSINLVLALTTCTTRLSTVRTVLDCWRMFAY